MRSFRARNTHGFPSFPSMKGPRFSRAFVHCGHHPSMSTAPRFFPPAIREALPSDEGVLLVKDRSGETLLLRIDDLRTRHHESWLKICPVDDDFGLDIAGRVAVPVHLYHVQKDVRGALTKLLRIGERPELSIPFYVDTGFDETVVFASEPQYAESALLTLESAESENPHQNIVSARNIGGVQISILQPLVPMRQYRHQRLASGRTRKFVTNNTDHGDPGAPPSLLKPEHRGVLDGIGKTVYEGDPTGTDRLLVCLKRYEEPVGVSRVCALFDPLFRGSLIRHKSNLAAGIESIESLSHHQFSLDEHGMPNVESHQHISSGKGGPSLHVEMRKRNDARNAVLRTWMIRTISSTLGSGGSAIVVCDGNGFESGTSAREPIRDSFESHARFLPKTQCIVIEDSAYTLLQLMQAQLHDFLLTQKNSNELLDMQHRLSEHMHKLSTLLHGPHNASRQEILKSLRESELEIRKIESTFITLFARRSRREAGFAS